jgi:endonuclease-3 related protein
LEKEASALMAFAPSAGVLRNLYVALERAYGVQAWWPAETAFEVLVGAVLTQNTAWSNVEKAIDRLKAADLLTLSALLDSDHDVLAETIRPSGYFNIKAQRLRNLCDFLEQQGGFERFAGQDLERQRRGLLGVNGIGPETADDILLYALERPVFVIDAYTRRLLARLQLCDGDEPYGDMRLAIEAALGPDAALFNEYHALIVRHAKDVCRIRPRCGGCVLNRRCPAASRD